MGLGWSWQRNSVQPGYACEGQNSGQNVDDGETYPMNRILAPFGAQWSDSYFQ